jgi:hypothetical protein
MEKMGDRPRFLIQPENPPDKPVIFMFPAADPRRLGMENESH